MSILCKIGLHKWKPITNDIKKGYLQTSQRFECIRCNKNEYHVVERHNDPSILETLPVEDVLKEYLSINYGVDEINYHDGNDFNIDLGLDPEELEELIRWTEHLYGIRLNLDEREDTTKLSELVKFIEDRK